MGRRGGGGGGGGGEAELSHKTTFNLDELAWVEQQNHLSHAIAYKMHLHTKRLPIAYLTLTLLRAKIDCAQTIVMPIGYLSWFFLGGLERTKSPPPL